MLDGPEEAIPPKGLIRDADLLEAWSRGETLIIDDEVDLEPEGHKDFLKDFLKEHCVHMFRRPPTPCFNVQGKGEVAVCNDSSIKSM